MSEMRQNLMWAQVGPLGLPLIQPIPAQRILCISCHAREWCSHSLYYSTHELKTLPKAEHTRSPD